MYDKKWPDICYTFCFIKRAYVRQLLLKLREERWMCTEALDVEAAATIICCLEYRLFLSQCLLSVSLSSHCCGLTVRRASLQHIVVLTTVSASLLYVGPPFFSTAHPVAISRQMVRDRNVWKRCCISISVKANEGLRGKYDKL